MSVTENPKIITRSDFKWQRKLLHIFNGSLGYWLYVYSGLSESMVLTILAACVVLFGLLDFFKKSNPHINSFVFRQFHPFLREHERYRFNSATKGLAMTLVVLIICPRAVDVLVILFVTFGDPMGAIVGHRFGKHRINQHASLEGTLAVFGACWLVSLYAMLWVLGWDFNSSLVGLSLAAAFIGAFSEAFFEKWDDNVMVPLVSAPLLTLLFYLSGVL